MAKSKKPAISNPVIGVFSRSQSVQPTSSVKLLVADQFRVEAGGKVLAIGLYPDGVVVMQMPADAPDPTDESPVGIAQLALLLSVSGSGRSHNLRVQLGADDAKEFPVDLGTAGSVNVILDLRPLVIRSFGIKPVVVELAGERHELSFEIRRGVGDVPGQVMQLPPALAETASAPSPKKPRRKAATSSST